MWRSCRPDLKHQQFTSSFFLCQHTAPLLIYSPVKMSHFTNCLHAGPWKTFHTQQIYITAIIMIL